MAMVGFGGPRSLESLLLLASMWASGDNSKHQNTESFRRLLAADLDLDLDFDFDLDSDLDLDLDVCLFARWYNAPSVFSWLISNGVWRSAGGREREWLWKWCMRVFKLKCVVADSVVDLTRRLALGIVPGVVRVLDIVHFKDIVAGHVLGLVLGVGGCLVAVGGDVVICIGVGGVGSGDWSSGWASCS